jgi:hypothetical protein
MALQDDDGASGRGDGARCSQAGHAAADNDYFNIFDV